MSTVSHSWLAKAHVSQPLLALAVTKITLAFPVEILVASAVGRTHGLVSEVAHLRGLREPRTEGLTRGVCSQYDEDVRARASENHTYLHHLRLAGN